MRFGKVWQNKKMKATELRIGNLVLDDTSDNIMIVSKIESVSYTEWNSGDKYNISCLQFGTKQSYYDGNFKPIPLTEEWLLKFGFEKDDFSSRFIAYKNKIRLIHDTQKNTFLVDSVNHVKLYLQYVHQLQNLFHSLCGEELQINATK